MWRVLLLSLFCLFLSSCWSWRDVIPGPPDPEPTNPYKALAVWAQWIGGLGIILSVASLIFTQGTSIRLSVKILGVSFGLMLTASLLGWVAGHPLTLLLLAFVGLCSLLAWWLYGKSERFRHLFETLDDKQASITGIEVTDDGSA